MLSEGDHVLRRFFFFFFFRFLDDEGREDPSITIRGAIIGPPAERHDGPTLNAGLVAL